MNRHKRGEFTIIEVGVALAVVTLIALMIYSVMQQSKNESQNARECVNPVFKQVASETQGFTGKDGYIYTNTKYIYECEGGRIINLSKPIEDYK